MTKFVFRKMNSIHRMPHKLSGRAKKEDEEDKKRKSKNVKKGGSGHHDDSDVDSKGNIKGLIDYEYDENDSDYEEETETDTQSESSDTSPPQRKAALAARKKIQKELKKEKQIDETGKLKKKSNKKVVEESEESDESDESEEEVTTTRKSKKHVKSSAPPSSKKSKIDVKSKGKRKLKSKVKEETDDEDEEEEDDFKEFQDTDDDDDEDDEDDDEYDDDDDDDDEDEEDDMGHGGNLILTLGGSDEDTRMIPQRYNMKKEPEEVKKFVKLVTAPLEDNTIDAQIDQFKALSPEKQKELLQALEKRPTLTDTGVSLMLRILQMKLPSDIQAMLLAKYNSLQSMDPSTGEYFKMRNWLDKAVSVPFGMYKEIPIKIEDGPERCAEFMTKARKTLDEAIYGQDETKLQIMQYMSTKIANPSGRGMSLLLIGPPGIGKCHAKDTQILMADGSIKLVQDIVVGDAIMGDDSKPRKVLSLGRGQDTMYDIIPTKGDSYRVNSEHIMCLKQSGKGNIKLVKGKNITYKAIRINNKEKCLSYKTFKTYDEANDYLNSFTEEDNILEISVKEYLNLPKEIKDGWLKGYRKGVDFPYVDTEFDPYIIGLWLGDGTSSNTGITSQDAEIITYLQKTLPQYNLMLSYHAGYNYNIRAITTGKNDNVLLNVLKKYNMINNKHIPAHYKCNSRDIRLKVLAGLVDTDGFVAFNTIEISQKSKQLADDILYLARSLGFAAYSKEKVSSWTYDNVKKFDTYYRITISGDIAEIPIRIKRKIPDVRLQNKDVLVTGITIKEVGYGDYYGFTLDGNHRYLMGDFTVTHNTSLIKNGIAKALDWPFQFISLGGDSDASTYTGHQLVYESSHCGKIVNSLVSAKSMSMILLFDELDKVSTTAKGEEVQNLLVHLTDPAANGEFEDKYLAGMPIDLSRTMLVFSANDITKIDKVLLDRLMVIDLKGYELEQKIVIAENYLLPAALKEVNLVEKVGVSKEMIKYIIEHYASNESGVRELKRCMEQIAQKVNMLRMYNSKDLPFYVEKFSLPFVLKKEHVDLFLKKRDGRDNVPFGMYT